MASRTVRDASSKSEKYAGQPAVLPGAKMKSISRAGGGCIVSECRSPDLDAQLDLAWQELRASGTYHVPAKTIRRRIASFTMRRKNENLAGLQIADLIVSPIGRFVVGKPVKDDFRIIERKFRRNARGDYAGYGLVELPRKRPAPATQ